MKNIIHLLLIALIFLMNKNFSQTDSTSPFYTPKKSHSFLNIKNWSPPKKASVLSAIIPGAGQMYNKKYWKVPIIYGVGGLLFYNAFQQNNHYLYYKKELINVINGGVNSDGYSSQQLTLLKNQSKKWRDLSIAGTVLIYVLNILDANVDAHLKTFDVSDNLSLIIQPEIIPNFTQSPSPNILFSVRLLGF
ncbi:MAG TPA: DUF5683 domain-containing protein [Bacteroidia bacterium]|nr:DUF5683 domain-containing protein [Bacteroidia bacterium]